MHDLDLLVPDALVDAALAGELLGGVELPELSRLVGRGGEAEDFVLARHASLTPWQAWVFGLRAGLTKDAIARDVVNLAELAAMGCGIAPASRGQRWLAEPARFQIARDHLRLDDPRGLAVTIAEARALAESIEPILLEAGWRLEPIEPATLTHWLLHRDDAIDLSGAAIERAIGDNVANWQPRSMGEAAGTDAALAWRRCINEIQMLWFGHPVNESREERGLPPINTLWLSGNGGRLTAMPHYRAIDSDIGLLVSLPAEPDAPRALETFDALAASARAEDWSAWRDATGALDARLGAIAKAQRDGTIGALTLVLCGRDRLRSWTVAQRERGGFFRDWGAKKTPALAPLFAEELA